jgi:hypothetical protein
LVELKQGILLFLYTDNISLVPSAFTIQSYS